MNNNKTSIIYLDNEVLNSVNLIKRGICDLKLAGVNIYANHIPLMMLSSGFERLLKCIICLRYSYINEKYPDINFFRKKFGHDIEKLLSYISEECKKMKYDKRPATEADMNFLKENEELHNFVSLLSDFGKGARYYNLDMVTSGKSEYIDPEEIISKIENNILDKKPELKKLMGDVSKTNEFNQQLNNELVIILERFARALCRLFTLGELGDVGPTMTGYIGDFLFLMDADLGIAEYCNES